MEEVLAGQTGETRVSSIYFLLSSVLLSNSSRAMIQILLNMLKLSLPGPQPPRVEEKSPEKRKKRRKKMDGMPVETDAERLESYMDKLSMWQLTASLDNFSAASGAAKGTQKSDRDWAQAFCEDIVEPL